MLKSNTHSNYSKYLNSQNLEKQNVGAILETYRNNKILWKHSNLEDIRELPLKKRILSTLVHIKQSYSNINDWEDIQEYSEFNTNIINLLKKFFIINHSTGYSFEYNLYNKFVSQAKSIHYYKNLERMRCEFDKGGFIGGVSEWDRDEQNFWDYKNLTFRTPSLLNTFKVYGGSYNLNWGYGLLFNNDLFHIRSASSIYNAEIHDPKFYNYLSSNESQYLFGLSLNIEANNFLFLPFYSKNGIDSHLENDKIVNISKSGQHITPGQLARKNNTHRIHYGLGTLYDYQIGETGVLLYTTRFSNPIKNTNASHFPGFSLIQIFEFKKMDLGIEGALVSNKNFAVKLGSDFELQDFEIGYSFRYYSPHFYDALGCPNNNYSGNIKNEKGYNIAVSTDFPYEIDVTGYVDFSSPLSPEEAGEFSKKTITGNVELYKDFGETVQARLKFKRKIKQQNSFRNQKQIKGKVIISLNDFDIVSRAGYKKIDKKQNPEQGFAHSVYFKFEHNNFHYQIGTSNFYTKSFNSKIYLYEPGPPNRFNLPVLFGTGYRHFLLINHRINELFMLYFKAAYLNRKKLHIVNWKNKTNFEITFNINI